MSTLVTIALALAALVLLLELAPLIMLVLFALLWGAMSAAEAVWRGLCRLCGKRGAK